jgi:pimeloyl-ACP methyl ester carboxylesterase
MTLGRFRSAAGRERFAAAYAEAMAELPAPERVADVPTAFGTVRTYRFAATGPTGPAGPMAPGPPLVLLHGTSASTPMWADNLPGLLRIRPVVSLDLLGEPGMSEQTREIRSPAEHAAWLAEALDGAGVTGAHLVGVSLGGWCAVNLARHHPQLVASLTALDPAHTFGRAGPKVVLVSLGVMVPGPLRDASLRWLAGGAEAGDSAVGRLIGTGMQEWRSALSAPRYPTDDQLRAITAPALVVIAGRSIIHHPARAAARARLLPRARVELWPDASHALNGEFPDRIAQRVSALVGAVAAAD